MKQFILTLTVCCMCLSGFAQQSNTDNNTPQKEEKKAQKPSKPPVCYIGLSGGSNNPAGIIGFDINIPLSSYVTLDGGTGPSTWGNKLYVGSKFYLRPQQRGWAFAGGLTFSSGVENMKKRLETINGRQEVTLSLKAQTNIYIGVYHYWTMGRRYNRFFVNFGGSVPLTSQHYHEIYGAPLTDRSHRFIDRMAPGGLMAGLGFSFSLYNRHGTL